MTASTGSVRRAAPSHVASSTGRIPSRFVLLVLSLGVVAIAVAINQQVLPSIRPAFLASSDPLGAAIGTAYWTALTMVGSTLVVKMRSGSVYGSHTPFVIAAAVLGGPPSAAVVALVGTLELRELRELRPWQIAQNHAQAVVGAVAAAMTVLPVTQFLARASIEPSPLATLTATMVAAIVYCLIPTMLAFISIALWRRRPFWELVQEELLAILLFSLVAMATAWVMIETYVLVAWWSPIVVLAPVLASWLALDRDRARWQADHDSLTELANRSLFEKKLRVAEHRARRSGRPSLVLSVDLDGFKAINDEHGHPTGDEILRAVARRLEGAVRRGDVVARFGGDEFAVLMWNVGDADFVEQTATRLRLELARPVASGALEISVGASVGVAVLSPELPDASEVMQRADESLYIDKRRRSDV
jgi:diguanylate cyclase (GGDEF)-like protein